MSKERELLLRICEAWIESAASKGEFDQTHALYRLRAEVYKAVGLDELKLKCLRDCGKGIFVLTEIARVTDLKCYRDDKGSLVVEGSMPCKDCGSIMFGSTRIKFEEGT